MSIAKRIMASRLRMYLAEMVEMSRWLMLRGQDPCGGLCCQQPGQIVAEQLDYARFKACLLQGS